MTYWIAAVIYVCVIASVFAALLIWCLRGDAPPAVQRDEHEDAGVG